MTDSRKSFLEKGPPPPRPRPSSLYAHVGFCRRRCRYCDFSSQIYDVAKATATIEAMTTELTRRRGLLRKPLATAFVGGGTPTVLEPALLEQLLGAIGALGDAGTEFSVEANPASLSEAKLQVFSNTGVNRISLGVQSFDDAELAVLGRIHDTREAAAAIRRAQRAGFDNLSIDLIYGVPGQTLDSWRHSLGEAIASDVSHVSCYCLSYPEGTALADDLAAGRVKAMSEEDQRRCWDLACQMLGAAGVERYEISNFARPRRRCRHNLVYWRNGPYIGVGPAAVSYLAGRRASNIAGAEEYTRRIQASESAEEFAEAVDKQTRMAETLMLGLRLTEGVGREVFRRRFNVDMLDMFGPTLHRYASLGMLTITDNAVALTDEAVFVSDTIFADLLAEARDD